MPNPKVDEHQQAVAVLRRRDRRLAAIIDAVGPYRPRLTRQPFVALVGAIIHQQVSMSAAATIRRRLVAACRPRRLSPAALLAMSEGELQAVGLSRQKRAYLRDLSAHFARRRLSGALLRRLDDEAVVERVTAVKGIGRWTAEMLLIFSLERPDVWPIDDLGVQTAARRLVGSDEPLEREALLALGEAWRPYRTYATWYLWRSLAQPEPPAIS